MAKAWTKHVSGNKKFRFTAKVWRGFTHERNATSADEAEFKTGIEPLLQADRLGALLLQFPISFKNTPDERTYLHALHRRFADYPLVLEVRHASWNDRTTLEMLAELDIGFCNIDQPRLGASLRATAEVTSDIGYVRLHGRNYKEWLAENKQPSAIATTTSTASRNWSRGPIACDRLRRGPAARTWSRITTFRGKPS